jgi:hypothetical protein
MALAPMSPVQPPSATKLSRRRQIAQLAKARVHSERARRMIDFVLGLPADGDG